MHLMNDPRQEFFQKDYIVNEDAYHRSLCSVFEIVLLHRLRMDFK